MHFLSIFLYSLSSNIDSFAVGMTYGIKKIYIPCKSALLISFMTFAGTIAAMAFGKSLLCLIPAKTGGLLGGIFILCMGVYYLGIFFYKFIKKYKKTDATENLQGFPLIDSLKPIENTIEKKAVSSALRLKEAILLGFALSINNVGLGIGASITGLNLLLTSFISFLCALLLLTLGNKVGNGHVAHLIGDYAEPLSGLIMILLGLLEIFI